jgi:FkbM family methyltransferase
MPKLDKTLSLLIPQSPIREVLKSAYYSFYYNRKHAKDNGFKIYYTKHIYKFVFPNGVSFKCYQNIADDLQRTMPGYIAKRDIKKGDVVIDGGAYVGEFALYAAKASGDTGQVIVFELDPIIFKKLKANVILNDLRNVILIEKGLWSKEDLLKFSGGTQGGNLFSNRLDCNTSTHEVFVTTIDVELEKLGISKVDFIKLDLEGSEIEVLKAAKKTLLNNDAHIVVASYHVVNGQKTHIEIENIFREFGYSAETGYPAHLTTYGYKSKKDVPFRNTQPR